jgi:hypothetical protein
LYNIYNAANKPEAPKNTESDSKQKETNGANWKIYLVVGLVAFFGYFAAKALFGHIGKTHDKQFVEIRTKKVALYNAAKEAKKKAKQASAAKMSIPQVLSSLTKEISKSRHIPLTLDGIAYSPENSYVLINNKILQVGDKIDGSTVVNIEQDYVELKGSDSKIFKLSTLSPRK